jgi:hypothetical protein
VQEAFSLKFSPDDLPRFAIIPETASVPKLS